MRFVFIALIMSANQAFALIGGEPLRGFRDLVKITMASGESVCTGFL